VTDHPDLAPLRSPSRAADRPDRGELLGHLARCARCRAELAADDPSRLFALLTLSEPPPGTLERLSREVRRRTAASAVPRRRHWRAAGGAMAASLALAAALGGFLWRSTPPVGRALAEAWPAAAVEAKPVTTIELSQPPSAQMLDLSIGETQVILIFDEALDI
jgi:hypothetical protein